MTSAELMTFIRTMMPYYVNLAEELQLLSGDNVGEDLHGLIPQAAAFLTSELLTRSRAGTRSISSVAAIQQITAAKELPPTFVVMHPNDWWDIRLTKDGFGRYILGDPQQGSLAGVGFGISTPARTSSAWRSFRPPTSPRDVPGRDRAVRSQPRFATAWKCRSTSRPNTARSSHRT